MKKNKKTLFQLWLKKHEFRLVVPAKFTAVTKKLTVFPFKLSFVESKTVKQQMSLNVF